jgi:hypothetical protein
MIKRGTLPRGEDLRVISLHQVTRVSANLLSLPMNKYLTDIRLGDLLTKTGIVSAKQVTDAVRTAGNKNLHFGQILVLSGCLKSSDLSAGIAAQSAIRDQTLDRRAASRALETACKNGISFNEALRSIGASPDTIPTNRLGDLIIDAGLLTAEQCHSAIDKSLSTGLPVGRILVSHNLLAEDMLLALLEVQLRIRDGLLTRQEAIATIAANPEKSREPQTETRSYRGIRLGELLVRAGILSRTDVINVLEVGLQANQKTGQLLIKFGFISASLLEKTLNLQQMVNNKFISIEQASKCLKHVEAHGISVSEALVQLDMLKLPGATSQGNPNLTLGGAGETAGNKRGRETADPKYFGLVEHRSATGLDSTFGEADRISWNAMDVRTRRLIRSLRSAAQPKLSPELGIAFGELTKAYKRLAVRHVHYHDYHEAEWIYERVLALRERLVGQLHPSLAIDLKRLCEIQISQRKFGNAERTIRRAVLLLEQSRPYNGVLLGTCLNMLAMIYFEQGFYQDAEPLLTRALTLKELNYPADHPELADTLRDYARLLAKTERFAEAEKVYFQARAILLRQQKASRLLQARLN